MKLFERILYKIYLRTSWSGPTKHIKRLVSKLACPGRADEHFWHDGCWYCDLCSSCGMSIPSCKCNDYPYNIEFGNGRTKEEMDKMHNQHYNEDAYWKGVRDMELGCKTCFNIYESAIPGADTVPCPECKRLPSLDAL